MKRDLQTAAPAAVENIVVPQALFMSLVERVIDLTEPRLVFEPGAPASERLDNLPAIGAAYEGGLYAGVSLTGSVPVALILLPGDLEEADWKKAKAWAAEQGGGLPSRIDALVLFENLKKEFKPDYYWTSAPYASVSSYAWMQGFYNGSQYYYHTSNESRARAVRRVPIR